MQLLLYTLGGWGVGWGVVVIVGWWCGGWWDWGGIGVGGVGEGAEERQMTLRMRRQLGLQNAFPAPYCGKYRNFNPSSAPTTLSMMNSSTHADPGRVKFPSDLNLIRNVCRNPPREDVQLRNCVHTRVSWGGGTLFLSGANSGRGTVFDGWRMGHAKPSESQLRVETQPFL